MIINGLELFVLNNSQFIKYTSINDNSFVAHKIKVKIINLILILINLKILEVTHSTSIVKLKRLLLIRRRN